MAAILRTDVGHNPEDPGGKPGLTSEVWKAAVDLQEDLLRQIVGSRAIGRQSPDHAVNEMLVPLAEFAESDVIAGPTPLDERLFVEVGHSPTILESEYG